MKRPVEERPLTQTQRLSKDFGTAKEWRNKNTSSSDDYSSRYKDESQGENEYYKAPFKSVRLQKQTEQRPIVDRPAERGAHDRPPVDRPSVAIEQGYQRTEPKIAPLAQKKPSM